MFDFGFATGSCDFWFINDFFDDAAVETTLKLIR